MLHRIQPKIQNRLQLVQRSFKTAFARGILLFVVAGCAVPQISSAPSTSSPATGTSSEPATATKENNQTGGSNQTIAQAPASGAAQRYRQTVVLDGLEHPWSMAWLPDGAMLVTERPGRLRIVRNDVLDPTPIAGVPPVFASGQGGLMEVSLHPQFAQNRFVYLTYSHGNASANQTRVARGVLEGQTLRDVQTIFEAAPQKSSTQHFGSRIQWLPDGTMLVSIGDGGNPPVSLNGDLIRRQAQNLQSRLGKIVRLNDDGSIPANNPFASNANADPAIWSYGHRNIQGLTLNPATGQVWATEHGARGGDELNQMQAGNNYGWPLVTYSREYSGGEISSERSRPGLIDPKTVWQSGIAPSGLTFYTGDRLSGWKGDLFAGGLVGQAIQRIDLDASGNVVGQQTIAINQRVRDVRQGPDGLLYVLTDESNGQMIRIEPVAP
ncbi:PQQ-dependent sugar dehydrogenase [Leptolyngbya sp. FACHB-711]|uniref:PQQ-dependent sugar dehydrogenase n=1 Tax=unclassified Leptolyngbya TaxID=2650499 RepID=UPI00168713FF|nr:PQQ-dependent sugar dehydrogenase [Leptolyngbya sp. FACHB-711]MBD1852667.1 PQQ-dependent sugar dehydrogenase [Cyanobacteria bacterium FACHB-502]MBD2027645.1 PQQ-dependent sugar dehydrogenase [Leptolyngbya sp. FACHB-711]